jgi:hypothetical protein
MQQRLNQRNNVAFGAFLLFFLAGASVACASQTSGTIDPAHKYAWGNVAGYVNFAPTNGGLTITDSAITGYAWGANTGWINFNASQSHVTNDSHGTLGGFAWDSGGGWISFTGVTIDTIGRFHGTATGGTVNGASYFISFDCAYCNVSTDWRPTSAPIPTTSSSGGGGGSISPMITSATSNVSSTATTPTPLTKASPSSPSASSIPSKNASSTKKLTATTTTTFKNTPPPSSPTHATPTPKKAVTFSFLDLVRMIVQNIIAVTISFFTFFSRIK